MCGANKEKFIELINKTIRSEPDKLQGLKALINQELQCMKLAKRMANGKRYLEDSTYQIRDSDD